MLTPWQIFVLIYEKYLYRIGCKEFLFNFLYIFCFRLEIFWRNSGIRFYKTYKHNLSIFFVAVSSHVASSKSSQSWNFFLSHKAEWNRVMSRQIHVLSIFQMTGIGYMNHTFWTRRWVKYEGRRSTKMMKIITSVIVRTFVAFKWINFFLLR